MHSLGSFCTWLAATSLSQRIQTIEWIIPAVQTLHILAVAALISSALMIDLRLLGIGARDQSVAAVAQRFSPWIWTALPMLLATGGTLIIAEPARALQNPVFITKMMLLLVASAVTLACQIPLRGDAQFWELSAGRRRAARVLALLSLPLWVAIVFAGRWIAYVQVS